MIATYEVKQEPEFTYAVIQETGKCALSRALNVAVREVEVAYGGTYNTNMTSNWTPPPPLGRMSFVRSQAA